MRLQGDEVFVAVAHRVQEKYCTVGRAKRGWRRDDPDAPVSLPATEA
jgi:hypothetical protein